MLAILSLFLLASVSAPRPCVPDDYDIDSPENLFILAGQSNMAGRGSLSLGIPPECKPNPSIFRLNAKLNWETAKDPLHQDIDFNKTNGIGPGMSFANAILDKDPSLESIGLIPCAVGGKLIIEWSKGGWLYDNMMKRTRVALESGGTIRALLWYQGEDDTNRTETVNLYKERTEKFFNDVRADLELPTLPIFFVALASTEERPLGKHENFDIIREAQLGIKLPNMTCVDGIGLPLRGDVLHLSTPAQVRLGQMLADAFLSTIP